MTNKLMQWHLARDNQIKLARFCDKHQVNRNVGKYYTGHTKNSSDEKEYFQITTWFDNGGYITAELCRNTDISENYQVVDYGWGNK